MHSSSFVRLDHGSDDDFFFADVLIGRRSDWRVGVLVHAIDREDRDEVRDLVFSWHHRCGAGSCDPADVEALVATCSNRLQIDQRGRLRAFSMIALYIDDARVVAAGGGELFACAVFGGSDLVPMIRADAIPNPHAVGRRAFILTHGLGHSGARLHLCEVAASRGLVYCGHVWDPVERVECVLRRVMSTGADDREWTRSALLGDLKDPALVMNVGR